MRPDLTKKLTTCVICITSLIYFISNSLSVLSIDTNTTNNLLSTSVNITEVPDLSITFVQYVRNETDSIDQYYYKTAQYIDYLKKVFPLSDYNNYTIELEKIMPSQDLIEGINNKTLRVCDLLTDIQLQMFLSKKYSDRFVGIVKSNFHPNVTTSFSCPGFFGSVIQREDQYISTSAHEIGHTFGLCDEYNRSLWLIQNNTRMGGCPNAKNKTTGSFRDDCKGTNPYGQLNDGCPVENESIIKNLFFFGSSAPLSPDNLTNLYGSFNEPKIQRWINKESYLEILNKKNSFSLVYEPTSIVFIKGRIYANFTVLLDAFYVMSDGFIINQTQYAGGNFSIKLKDKFNTTLVNISFTPEFDVYYDNGSIEQINQSSFFISLPFNNVSQFLFLNNATGQVLNSRNVSAYIPNVTLISPNGGQRFENPFNISWNASDLDNDTLAYAVLISADNGTSWSTLAIDLNTSFYEVSNAWFNYGTNYKVKVLATDGVNTGSDFSDSNFTIVPPPSVKVNSIDEIYSNESYKIYEVKIENDGSQTLSNLSWRFNTGLTIINSTMNTTLAVNEVMTFLFAYNYSSGGWMNVSLFAFDNNKSVNDSLLDLFFVGDLMVGGFKELFGNVTERVFEFIMSNQGNNTLTNVRWTVRTGNNYNFSSSSAINLSAYDSAYVIFDYNFSNTGSYNMTVNVSDSFNPDNRSLSLFIPDIVINNFTILNQSDSIVNFSFGLQNMLNKPVNASYKLNTGVQNISNTSIILSPSQNINFTVPVNYTIYGNFTAILNASDNYSHSVTSSLNVSVKELLISDLQKLYSSGTMATFEFIIKNLFSTNKTFSWSFNTNNTAGIIWSTNATTLMPNENVSILVQHNFSNTGTYLVSARANTTKANYSQSLNVTI
jgi:hypothetical protein